MNAILSFFRTLVGLFVDDSWLAASVVVWIAVSLLALHYLPVAEFWALAFVFGTILLLAASVFRAALIAARKRFDSARR